MSGSGGWKMMRVIICALVLCVAAPGCVKREPRTETGEDKAAPARDEKCGVRCRAQKRREKVKKERQARQKQKGRKTATKRPDTTSKDKRRRGKGVYHTVKKGETFWRICHNYGADQNRVARINGIKDPTRIEVGQRIWIPGADKTLSISPAPVGKGRESGKGDRSASRTRPPQAMKGTLAMPVPGGVITSKFGMRGQRMHEGIDISAPEGTPILAADDGKVVHSDNTIRGYGNMIIIKHASNLRTVYAHNRKNNVETGDMVRRGKKIAEVGSTGKASGPHLHFEVRAGEKSVNPEYYLP